MEAVAINASGAFMKWGIMKDVFVPVSQMHSRMVVGGSYFVLPFIDERTGRVTGTEKIDRHLSNNDLTTQEGDEVDLLVFQKTELGYKVIVNNKHLGLLHGNEVFRPLAIGERDRGFVKHIRPDSKIDVSLGQKGYSKVVGEEGRLLDLLKKHNGYLPYNDKSDPEQIYQFFGTSKKVFKMTIGSLYKKQLITFTESGIQLV
jgi:uncharacterized protein